MDKVIRKNGKWAKISGKRGAYILALGWQGDFAASKLQKWPNKYGAEIAARYWLND